MVTYLNQSELNGSERLLTCVNQYNDQTQVFIGIIFSDVHITVTN